MGIARRYRRQQFYGLGGNRIRLRQLAGTAQHPGQCRKVHRHFEIVVAAEHLAIDRERAALIGLGTGEIASRLADSCPVGIGRRDIDGWLGEFVGDRDCVGDRRVRFVEPAERHEHGGEGAMVGQAASLHPLLRRGQVKRAAVHPHRFLITALVAHQHSIIVQGTGILAIGGEAGLFQHIERTAVIVFGEIEAANPLLDPGERRIGCAESLRADRRRAEPQLERAFERCLGIAVAAVRVEDDGIVGGGIGNGVRVERRDRARLGHAFLHVARGARIVRHQIQCRSGADQGVELISRAELHRSAPAECAPAQRQSLGAVAGVEIVCRRGEDQVADLPVGQRAERTGGRAGLRGGLDRVGRIDGRLDRSGMLTAPILDDLAAARRCGLVGGGEGAARYRAGTDQQCQQ